MTDELCWMLNTCAKIKAPSRKLLQLYSICYERTNPESEVKCFHLTIPRNFPTFGVCLCYICGLAEYLSGTSQLILYFDHGMKALPSGPQSCSLSSSNSN